MPFANPTLDFGDVGTTTRMVGEKKPARVKVPKETLAAIRRRRRRAKIHV